MVHRVRKLPCKNIIIIIICCFYIVLFSAFKHSLHSMSHVILNE